MNRKKQEKKLDDIWSALIKSISGFCCQRCGDDDTIIDPHHIIKRTHKRLRWTVSNGIGLCRYKCHRQAEDNPVTFLEWMEDKEPERMEMLNAIKRKGVKIYNVIELAEIEKDLKQQLKQISEELIPF